MLLSPPPELPLKYREERKKERQKGKEKEGREERYKSITSG